MNDFIANIKSADDKIRGPAWQSAGPLGAPAVNDLAGVMADADFEIARSAKRALWKIVRYAGRPGAGKEAAAVVAAIIPLLSSGPAAVRRELVWMLSEIGRDQTVAPIAALLADADLREDARCCLERILGRPSLAALKRAFSAAPEEFKYALAESLRARGEPVHGYPSRKLAPHKSTRVQPLGA